MARYGWVLLLIAIVGTVFFANFLTATKNNLAALVSFSSLAKPTVVKQNGREALIAKVYSTYPFNHRSLIAINAGSVDGVAVGMAVTAGGNYLLGQVAEVSDNTSVVRTLFDKDWSLSVRLGDGEANALLVGGLTPSLSMIDKKFQPKPEDWAYSAGRDFPYGLKICTVANIQESVANSLKSADLVLPYQSGDLNEVAVIIK